MGFFSLVNLIALVFDLDSVSFDDVFMKKCVPG